MHSALSIVELLYRIFSDPILASQPIDKYDNPGKTDIYLRHPLLSLALTCKTFSDVALHVLWTEIDGIDRLLRTISDDIITVSDQGEWTCKRMAFKKQPEEQDWEPFDRYGALVTRFESNASGDLYQLSAHILEALKARHDLKGTPLLPNLQSLAADSQQLPYAHTLLGPRLSSLSISFSPAFYLGQLHDLRAFLELAIPNPPVQLGLLELKNPRDSFDFAEAHPKFTPLLSEFLINIQRKGGGLCSLRSLSFRVGFSSEALSFLFANERTREIQIRVDQFDLDQVLPPGSSSIKKDLRIVAIHAATGVTRNSLMSDSFFHEFFQRLNAPNLVSFMFWGAPPRTGVSDIRAIFTSLQQENASAESNINVKLLIIAIFPEPSENVTIDPVHHICIFSNSLYLICQPISSTDPTPRFDHLRTLALTVPVDLSDSDIGSLSSSLPSLKYFHFEIHRAGRTGRSRTTLIGLWFLAKNCRFLDYAGIWFDAVLDWEHFAAITQRTMPDASDSEGRRLVLQEAINNNFKIIAIGDSTIENIAVVTQFFEEVCPSLERVDRIEGEDATRWKIVRSALTGYCSDSDDDHSSSVVSSEGDNTFSSDEDSG